MRALLLLLPAATVVALAAGPPQQPPRWQHPAAAPATATATASERPWLNASLPTERRLALLVDALTPEELITQLVKYSQRIDRLGVPAFPWHMEAAHGVATGGDATVFPCSLARAATFDPELELLVARAIGVEARAKWNSYILAHGHSPPYDAEGLSLTLYAPEINVCRDPRWGRCQGEWCFGCSSIGVSLRDCACRQSPAARTRF